jgi:hypothetical protein
MARSLTFYFDIIFWINYAIYLVYAFIKYIVAPIFWGLLEKAAKAEKESCFANKFAKMTIPMRWLILQLFGGPLGIVERRDDEYKPDTKDDNKIPTLYIRNTKISYGGIMVLCLIIVTFGILTLSSATNLSLLRITHVCSEDPHIDCYPQLIRGANETPINLLNLTVNTDEPILDCAPWNSEGVSSQVTFTCFQFIISVEVFLATVGGLSTVFLTTMKLAAGVLLLLTGCCKKCSKKYCTNCCKNSDKNYGKCSIRVVLIIAATVIELGLAITCFVIGASGALADTEGNSIILRFIAQHAVEALVVFGVVANLLWLPWEEYVK